MFTFSDEGPSFAIPLISLFIIPLILYSSSSLSISAIPAKAGIQVKIKGHACGLSFVPASLDPRFRGDDE